MPWNPLLLVEGKRFLRKKRTIYKVDVRCLCSYTLIHTVPSVLSIYSQAEDMSDSRKDLDTPAVFLYSYLISSECHIVSLKH